MATDIKKLAEELVKLTVLEVNELKNVLKDEYGIEPAAAAVAVAAGPAVFPPDGQRGYSADAAARFADGRRRVRRHHRDHTGAAPYETVPRRRRVGIVRTEPPDVRLSAGFLLHPPGHRCARLSRFVCFLCRFSTPDHPRCGNHPSFRDKKTLFFVKTI